MGRLASATAALLVVLALPAEGQLAPVGAPGGTLRIDIRGSFESADRRLGDGATEDYLADFGSPTFGSNRIPLLSPTDALVGAVIGQPGYRLNLGNAKARGQFTVGTGTIGAALGIGRGITLFANLPFVTTRVQANVRIDSTTGDAGVNPAHQVFGNGTGQGQADLFFSEFTTALVALDARIQQGFGGNTADSLDAVALLAEGITLRDQLETLTNAPGSASAFVPTATSAAGQAIGARVTAIQTELSGTYGITSFASAPVLAGSRLTGEEYQAFLSNPGGPIAAVPLLESKLSRMGDMDLGAVLTLVDRFDRPGTTGGFRMAVQGLVRLPTGLRDDPNNLLDVGTGNGRYEVGVSGTADLGAGSWGTRLTGGYLVRLSTFRVRRVTSPDQPYAEFARLGNVRLDAGDVINVGARPFFRLARNLAIHGLAEYWKSGRDRAEYEKASDSLPGIPASLLGGREGSSALLVGGGLTYSGRAARECEPGRRCGLPIEASWHYGTVVSASGLPVPKFRTTRLEIRWYQRLWR